LRTAAVKWQGNAIIANGSVWLPSLCHSWKELLRVIRDWLKNPVKTGNCKIIQFWGPKMRGGHTKKLREDIDDGGRIIKAENCLECEPIDNSKHCYTVHKW